MATPAPFTRTLLTGFIAGSLISLAGCGGTSPSNAAGGASAGTAPSATPSQSQSSAPPSGSQQPAQAPPAGYRWVGSSSQRFWLAVPRDWVALNLANISITAAIRKASFKGVANSALTADFQTLKQRHALFVADPASAVNSPHQFATNANVFCSQTAIQPGPDSANGLDAAFKAAYVKIGAHLVWLKNTTVSATKLIVTSELTAQTSGGYTITEIQVADLTNQGKLCELTLSTDQPTAYIHTMRKIGTTLQAG
ncbi:MAG: hypothetical protein ACLQFR_14795 [Streptosporangiaceae bacterium]